jgi:Replication-relaxation
MKTKRAAKPRDLLPLSPTEEEMLKTLSTYRFMTALDMAYSLFSPKSLTHVRSMLTRLAGGDDFQERSYLYRFPLPSGKPGNPERLFTLGSEGLAVVRSLGIPAKWYYRPSTTGRLNGSYLAHQLLVTRFVICACRFTNQHPDYILADVRLCYELEGQIGKQGGETVVPDAWLLFERVTDGARSPVLVEMDKGSEYQERFKDHVRGRLAFIQSGEYARVFGTPAVIIAYATIGRSQEHADTRRRTMAAWTMEVLRELELPSWAGIFRFTSALEYTRLYEQGDALFTEPVWYRPDEQRTPMLLLGS